MHTPTKRRRDPRRYTPSARVALPHKALYLVGRFNKGNKELTRATRT